MRRKKGLLFYDYTVRRNIQDLVSFANFVNTHDCFWMTVCNNNNILVRETTEEAPDYADIIEQLEEEE